MMFVPLIVTYARHLSKHPSNITILSELIRLYDQQRNIEYKNDFKSAQPY